MTQLFAQRQSAYTTEKARLQAKEPSSGLWVDIHGCYANSGPSESRISIRVDGPQDALQRFESGKPDRGSISLDKRYIAFGLGEDLLEKLKDAGSSLSTDFRIWYPGASLKAKSGGTDKAKFGAPAAVGEFKKSLVTIVGNDTLDLSDYAGPNGAIVFGADPLVAGSTKVYTIDQIKSKLTMEVSRIARKSLDDAAVAVAGDDLPAAAFNADGRDDVPYYLIKPPHWKEWNGYVDTTNDTASQESAADSNLSIRVNTRVHRSVDIPGIVELLS